MQVERGVFVAIRRLPSGEWVSNALVTCPKERNNSGKLELIPHVVTRVRGLVTEGVIRFGRDLRPISLLVG
jgi:hypothetical protein